MRWKTEKLAQSCARPAAMRGAAGGARSGSGGCVARKPSSSGHSASMRILPTGDSGRAVIDSLRPL
eukprot:4528716-Prymnesium_polylepis.1